MLSESHGKAAPRLWVIQPDGTPLPVGACVALRREADLTFLNHLCLGVRLDPPPEVALTIDAYTFGPGMDVVLASLRRTPLNFVMGLNDGDTKIESALRINYGGLRRRRTWTAFKFQVSHTVGGRMTLDIVGQEIGPVTIYQKYQKQKRETPNESEVRLRMS
jgi:hypothetical protein